MKTPRTAGSGRFCLRGNESKKLGDLLRIPLVWQRYPMLPETERARHRRLRPVRRDYRHVGSAEIERLRQIVREQRQAIQLFQTNREDVLAASRGLNSPMWKLYEIAVSAVAAAQAQLDRIAKPCGVVTTMPISMAETLAARPAYYRTAFCRRCDSHLPIDEFIWDGTNERVGS